MHRKRGKSNFQDYLIAKTLAGAERTHAVFGRGLAQDFLKNAVKMCQRLKPDFKGDFAYAQIGIMKQILRFFNPHARQVIRKIDSGNLLEHFAKIKCAHVDGLGHLTKRKVFGLMLMDNIERCCAKISNNLTTDS
jgi:hypothetical protein